MKLGLYLRNMGPESTCQAMLACARAAEAAGVDSLWVADHIAIPPDQSEGSGGRYLDPLATLAYLAGATERIGLGTGVLVLPYRPPLATAKWVATIQELSAGRLLFGVGAGWMEAEFRATGADRRLRGVTTDQTLSFLHRCFAADESESNGQPFLFLPRPERPPILVGGAGPRVLRRIVEFGDGWMPMGGEPDALRPEIEKLQGAMTEAGRPPAEVMAVTSLPLDDPSRAAARMREFAAAGVTGLIHGWRYRDSAEFARAAASLVALRS